MLPSHIAANGVEQQSVIPPQPPTPPYPRHPALHPSNSIAHMPLVPAVLVVWATPATCILLLPFIQAGSCEVTL